MRKVLCVSTRRAALLVGFAAVAAVSAPALAQDATGGVLAGNCGGTSGLDCKPFSTDDAYDGVVKQSFVIDMGQYPTSWGNWYGYAPIKSSQNVDPLFFTNLIGAQGASKRIVEVASPGASGLYDFWAEQGKGPGNAASQIAPPAGTLYRLGAGFSDFSQGAGNIVSATFEVSTDNYNRLYVTRYESVVNKPGAAASDNASFGFGSVDANGNPSFRVDSFGVLGTDPVQGQNWVSVNNSLRGAIVNDLFNLGGVGANTSSDSAATSYILDNGPTTSTPPTIIDAPGMASPLTAGGNFNGEYAYSDGSPSGVLITTGHLAQGPISAGTQRGNMSFTHTYTGLGDGANDAGTGAMLNRTDPVFNLYTDSMNIFAIDSDGSVDTTGLLLLTLPATNGGIVDALDGFNPFDYFVVGTGNGEFDHYHGQVAFRGGNGQVALAGDANSNGILYAAATVYYSGSGKADPWNYIAVAKYDVNAGTTQWNIASWNVSDKGNPPLPSDTGNCLDPGKPVLDGPGGNVIGRILPLVTVTGGVPTGPSVSAPMLDTQGNVYFMSAWEKFIDTDSNGTCDVTDPDSGLFKAHRLPNGEYELENLISLGNTIYGPNSNTRYSFRFMGTADSDSVSSGTIWSGNMVQDQLPGAYVNTLDTFDSGGFVVSVSVTYDVDTNGTYERPTGASPDDATSPDEAYDMMLYVRGYVRTGACCDGASCSDVSASDCTAMGGTFNGVGTVCDFTSCTPPLPMCVDSDVNCDGDTNAGDLLIVRNGANWEQPVGIAANPRADVNGDSNVNAGDLLVIRGGGVWETSTGTCVCP